MKRRNLSKIDLTGAEKGMLKIIERVPNTKSLWRCECKCGKQLQINTSRLLDYRRKSCGCLEREINKSFGENVWQRSYYDHIIRDDKDYLNIWQYIDCNYMKWKIDRFYKPK